jgi:type VI secretion system protein ImpH
MERTAGYPTSDLKTELLNRGRSYSFFQVLRLLKRTCAGHDGFPADRIRIRPNLSLAFPGTAVESVKESSGGGLTVLSNILGLYGTCSPLPTFYTEDLLEESDDETHPVRDLIDVVNHRLYELLYAAWKKYKTMHRMIEEGDTGVLQRFFCLTGMEEKALSREFDQPIRLLRYAGLFGMNSRSASGLETLLTDMYGHIPFSILQMVERKAVIPEDQRSCLGFNVSLGVNSVLGDEFPMRSGSFRIVVGPVSIMDYPRFIPGHPDYESLLSLVKLYVQKPLEFDVDVIMDKKEKPETTCLGAPLFARLGFDTWVFSDGGPDEFRTRFYPKKNAA